MALKRKKAKINQNPKANYKVPGHQLYVTRLSNLWRMFSRNKTDKSKRGLKARIYFFSILTTPLQWIQSLWLKLRLRNVDLTKTSPVFILGHWRSGTTHIHYTLAQDKQFTYLDNFNSFFFNICMLGGWTKKLLGRWVPSTRPMDNVEMTLTKPQEEEQVLSNLTHAAGVCSFYFPKNREYFYKYNLFQDISKREYRTWRKYYNNVLERIHVLGNGRRLLLKNPNNTARARQLLDLYPQSKFVYIHRNPYRVYLSTKHLHRAVLRSQALQDISEEDEDRIIIENYRLIMQGYLDSRDSIPAGHLVEIAYSDIGTEREMGNYENIYKTLNLGDWDAVRPKIEAYLDTKKGYKKNAFVPIAPDIVAKIQKEWGFIFEEFGYDLEYKDSTLSTPA